MRARMSGPSLAGSSPRIRRVPSLTGETAAIIRIVEDLPAPLGPRKPNDSPRRTSTSMPFTASTIASLVPNDLRSPTALIIESESGLESGLESGRVTVHDPRRRHGQPAPGIPPARQLPPALRGPGTAARVSQVGVGDHTRLRRTLRGT